MTHSRIAEADSLSAVGSHFRIFKDTKFGFGKLMPYIHDLNPIQLPSTLYHRVCMADTTADVSGVTSGDASGHLEIEAPDCSKAEHGPENGTGG